MRDDRFVRGDHRLAREQGGAHVVHCRLGAWNGFDDDVDVAGEEVVEAVGPGEPGERIGLARLLVFRAPITEMCEFEVGNRVGSAQPGCCRTSGTN